MSIARALINYVLCLTVIFSILAIVHPWLRIPVALGLAFLVVRFTDDP